MKDNKIEVGAVLRAERLRKGYTQTEIALRMGKSKTWLNDLEKGKTRIYFDDFVKICSLYEVSLNDMNEKIKALGK